MKSCWSRRVLDERSGTSAGLRPLQANGVGKFPDAGVYYTAFTAPSLNGPWTAAIGSWLSDGGPATFVVSIIDPSTGESFPSLFLILVASDDPYAPGAPL